LALAGLISAGLCFFPPSSQMMQLMIHQKLMISNNFPQVRNVHNYSWLVVSTPLKNMKVSWDYYSQYMGKYKTAMFQTTNQYILVMALKFPNIK